MMTIGCDPEFLLINRYNEVLDASEYSFFEGQSGAIGCDDAGIPVEIRPKFSPITEVRIMLKEIEILLTRIGTYCHNHNYTIIAGAGKDSYCHGDYDEDDCDDEESFTPIGGHIHFGKKELRRTSPDYEEKRTKLMKVLDNFFTPITNYFISPQELRRRVRSGYGRLSAYETKPWGFEYRTPYSFLMSPFLTKAFFSLSCLLAYHYKKISIPPFINSEMYEYYEEMRTSSSFDREMNREFLNPIYKDIKPKILRLMSYKSPNPEYNSYILALFSLIERDKSCKSLDVLRNYDLLPPKNDGLFLIFGSDSYLNSIQSILEDNIKNKTKGEVFIYGVAKRDKEPHTLKQCVYLSNTMPDIDLFLPNGVKSERITYGGGHKFRHSIGLSHELRKNIIMDYKMTGFLTRYLNSIKLKDEFGNYV